MQIKTVISGIVFLFLLLAAGCGKSNDPRHTDHENHAGETEKVHNEHDGESPETHSEGSEKAHDEHQGEEAGELCEEGEIELSPEGMSMAEITLAKAGMGRIAVSIDLSGEVGFNEDRLVHVTPRFPGIAQEARFRVGEFVNAGEVVATIESNESMTLYSLKAPISGRIIEKHIAPGEHVSEEESIYLLADLSSVWVNLAVYPKDASKVKQGQKVAIAAVGSDNLAEGAVHYVTPVIDVQTRRMTARVVLPNVNGGWRPGTFVNAHIEAGEGEEGLVVDKAAVQVLNDKHVIFVQHEPNRFRPVEVTTGDSDSRQIRILSGLEAGVEYVNNGAFELKAKIVTSSLGSHAGHGH